MSLSRVSSGRKEGEGGKERKGRRGREGSIAGRRAALCRRGLPTPAAPWEPRRRKTWLGPQFQGSCAPAAARRAREQPALRTGAARDVTRSKPGPCSLSSMAEDLMNSKNKPRTSWEAPCPAPGTNPGPICAISKPDDAPNSLSSWFDERGGLQTGGRAGRGWCP